MLENARPEALPAPHRGDAAARREVADLVHELRELKVEALIRRAPAGMIAGGVALPVAVTRGAQVCARSLRRVAELQRAGVPVTLCLRDLAGGDAAIDALEAFCNALGDGLRAQKLSPAGIGVSVPSHVVPLEAYLLLTAALLGHGPRYVVLDSLQMRHHDDARIERAADRNWAFIWRRREARPSLVPAYAASVTTRCPLLGDEAATAVLPELGLQVPVGSAWLPLVLHLADFSDGRGRLCWARLRRALTAAVDLGEALLDRLDWPDASLRRDAAENRRLAIDVRGIGDLVRERGADPKDLGCLRWLDGVVGRVHALLWGRSRALARELAPLPSLVRSEPTIGWRCDRSRSDWQLRWRRALAESAVRHRNLLVLSPYAVLPRAAPAASDYLDLLPVLDHADAFGFARPPAACFRNPAEFARFHRRAWAVMQRRNAASFVAGGV